MTSIPPTTDQHSANSLRRPRPAPDDRARDPWGAAPSIRGDEYAELAHEFYGHFGPVGKTLFQNQFDGWFAARGKLVIPPVGLTHAASNEWRGFLMNRADVRKKLNVAACHPRMLKGGQQSYVVMPYAEAMLELRAPEQEAAASKLPARLRTITQTYYAILQHLLQGANWAALDDNTWRTAADLYEEIGIFKRALSGDAGAMEMRFARLTRALEHRAASGGLPASVVAVVQEMVDSMDDPQLALGDLPETD